MEKKSITNHKVFLRKSAGYRAMTDRMLMIERRYLKELAGHLDQKPAYFVEGWRISLSIASYYIIQNSIYRSVFTANNESLLKSARKYIALAIDYLTKIYSTATEFLYTEKDIRAFAHAEIDEFWGYRMASRTAFYLEYLDQFFDVQSRWHWNILDLSYDMALIFKNTFIFKTLVARLDIRIEHAYERKAYVQQLKNYLNDVADGFRMKYEITRLESDMNRAIAALELSKQLHTAVHEPRLVEAQARKIELWQAKVISDQRLS